MNATKSIWWLTAAVLAVGIWFGLRSPAPVEPSFEGSVSPPAAPAGPASPKAFEVTAASNGYTDIPVPPVDRRAFQGPGTEPGVQRIRRPSGPNPFKRYVRPPQPNLTTEQSLTAKGPMTPEQYRALKNAAGARPPELSTSPFPFLQRAPQPIENKAAPR